MIANFYIKNIYVKKEKKCTPKREQFIGKQQNHTFDNRLLKNCFLLITSLITF